MQASNSLKMSIIGGIHAVHYFRGAPVDMSVPVVRGARPRARGGWICRLLGTWGGGVPGAQQPDGVQHWWC
jgi:hypothetical protein